MTVSIIPRERERWVNRRTRMVVEIVDARGDFVEYRRTLNSKDSTPRKTERRRVTVLPLRDFLQNYVHHAEAADIAKPARAAKVREALRDRLRAVRTVLRAVQDGNPVPARDVAASIGSIDTVLGYLADRS